MTVEPVDIGRGTARVLAIRGVALYVEAGGRILKSLDAGQTWSSVLALPRRLSGWGRLHRRALRRGVHACAVLPEDDLVFVAERRIWHVGGQTGTLRPVHTIARGSRPLFLCHTEDQHLFFGEYFGNAAREAVYIYGGTFPELSFRPVYCFPPGAIRHVHGVFLDPYDRSLWVTTGDNDAEAGIWRSTDGMATLQRVACGGQQQRAVALLFTERYLYYGSDTPLEQNFLYRLEKTTRHVDRLQAVEGSVFYACKVGERLFFSTVVEPSRINRTPDACLWASADGVAWRRVRQFRKDRWPLKLFQYGQVLFPSGINDTDRLWFTPLATDLDQTLQSLAVASMFG